MNIFKPPQSMQHKDIMSYNQKLFLAGGITDCPDWQKDVIDMLRDANYDGYVINPRRDDFDVNDTSMEYEQIQWEHTHLRIADCVLFWFPKETLCPITLFELGKMLVYDGKALFIGTHPDYKRRSDVCIQSKLERPYQHIFDNLEDTVKAFIGE